MNAKETLNFISLQEQVVNVLVRVSALESVLRNSGVLNVELYTKELNDITAVVTDKMKAVYENLDKLNQVVSTKDKEEINTKS